MTESMYPQQPQRDTPPEFTAPERTPQGMPRESARTGWAGGAIPADQAPGRAPTEPAAGWAGGAIPSDQPAGGAIPVWRAGGPEQPVDHLAIGSQRPRRSRRIGFAAAALVLVLAGGTAGGVVGEQLADRPAAATSSTVASSPLSGTTLASLSSVVDAVAASVVTITISSQQGTAEGSGVVLTADGLVLTNAHVVESGGTISVLLADGTTTTATVVGQDTSADLAVLKLAKASGLTPATLGDSDSLQVGQTVLAFGSPLGLQGTVTSGIVSALHRDAEEDSDSQPDGPGNAAASASDQTNSLSDLIQTDAAINSGNSGGALVDTAGRVVGINVAIATTGDSTGSIGVGFAIPVNTVKTVVNQITDGAV